MKYRIHIRKIRNNFLCTCHIFLRQFDKEKTQVMPIYFLLSCVVVKVQFFNQILEVDALMDLQVFNFPESENHVFSGWSVYKGTQNNFHTLRSMDGISY